MRVQVICFAVAGFVKATWPDVAFMACVQDLVAILYENQTVPIDDQLIASTVAPLKGKPFSKRAH